MAQTTPETKVPTEAEAEAGAGTLGPPGTGGTGGASSTDTTKDFLFDISLYGLDPASCIPELPGEVPWPISWEEAGTCKLLKPYLLRSIALRTGPDRRGTSSFDRPTAIQTLTLRLALVPLSENQSYPNLVAQAPSGCGKTAAFSLTLLSRIDSGDPSTQALVICCSRELATQVCGEIELFAVEDPRNKVRLLVPHAPVSKSPETFQVAVGTPGSIRTAVRQRKLDLSKLRVLVVDEADTLVRTPRSSRDGAVKDVNKILPSVPKGAQRLMFSATFDEGVLDLCRNVAPDHNKIFLPEFSSLDYIQQVYVRCQSDEDKDQSIAKIFDAFAFGAAFIFANTRDKAKTLAKALRDRKYKVAGLMGSGPQSTYQEREQNAKARDEAMAHFRAGEVQALIATNVLARGIDELRTRLVINYELPSHRLGGDTRFDAATYIHRIGRCGRFGTQGWAVSLIGPEDEDILSMLQQSQASHGIMPCRNIDAFLSILPTKVDGAAGAGGADNSDSD